MEEVNFLILGAGLTGLAAASVLGDQAIVLEQEDRPGGLVQAECFDGYWFDHVLHLLYFADPQTESRIRELLGEDLSPCLPEAWVETTLGTVRFPYQMHLGGLAPDTIIRSIRDLAEVTFTPCSKLPLDFEDMLLRTFGRGMCEDFLFPYNRKMWKRPLSTLAPAGFTWNITPPDFQQVIRGALTSDHDFRAYNSTGWYPRPGKDAPIRGMEVLSRALANQAHDLRLRHIVEEIDVEHRRVIARNDGQLHIFQFREACLSTLPLPHVIEMCRPVPERLNHNCQRLTRNRVLMAFLSIKGPRVSGRGHWRYYSDETISFHRLVYMHEFDPDSAPPDGWGLMAEITEPSENPLSASDQILARVRRDIERVGALPPRCRFVDAHLLVIDPAYVVFTVENRPVVEAACEFLQNNAITPLGRYGRWEYSSMAQVMRDGFEWAESTLAALTSRAFQGKKTSPTVKSAALRQDSSNLENSR